MSVSLERLLEQLDDDVELLVDLIDCFLEDCPRSVEELERCLTRGEAESARRQAHNLKGALATFTDGPSHTVAEDLESALKRQDLEYARSTLPKLRACIAQVVQGLEQLRKAMVR